MERCLGTHSAEGLRKIRRGRVAIAGVGCDGCEVAEQLVRTGIGKITLIDHDIVEETNLNRQRLFSMNDIGVPKVVAAKRRLEQISPHTKILVCHEKLTDKNGTKLLSGHGGF